MAAVESGRRYPIKLGKSFSDVVGSRGDASKRSKTTNHAIKYKFKPESTSTSAPGVLLNKNNDEGSDLYLPTNSTTNNNEYHHFVGEQTVSKPTDCFMYFDAEQQAFIVERMSSSFNLTHKRKVKESEVGDKKVVSLLGSSSSSNVISSSSSNNDHDLSEEDLDLIDEILSQ